MTTKLLEKFLSIPFEVKEDLKAECIYRILCDGKLNPFAVEWIVKCYENPDERAWYKENNKSFWDESVLKEKALNSWIANN